MEPCIVCGGENVREFLDLGRMPLANKFLTPDEVTSSREPTYPLRIGFCPGCAHVQLIDHVAPQSMFDDYLYISSASNTLTEHLHDLAAIMSSRLKLLPSDLVVDIGSNDGTLLSGFLPDGPRTLGIDPAANLSSLARSKGVETLTAYFGEKTARQVLDSHGPARLITSTNSFPHLPNLQDFLKGVDILLAPNGTMVIEAHYLRDLIEQNAFDTIYHEHFSYWALSPMVKLFDQFDMEPVMVERLPLHHGQIRVTVQRKGANNVHESVGFTLEEEKRLGMHTFDAFSKFAERAIHLRDSLQDLLRQLASEGKRVAGYGAPAKSSTLISFMQLGPETISYIADRSPLKQGRLTPGAHIKIVAPEHLLEDRPDYVVLLAWNFIDEIVKQQEEYMQLGGKFIVPVPEVRIL